MSIRQAREAGYVLDAMMAYCQMAGFRADADTLHDLAHIAVEAIDECREQQKGREE